jgi:hypothetical protein
MFDMSTGPKSLRQIISPVCASKQDRMAVMPSVYNLPPDKTGVE